MTAARRARLRSYGGDRVECDLVEPADVDELIDALSRARAEDRRITFRGQGHAFDSQSLNPDLVVGLRRLRGLAFSQDASTVEAGAGESWGDLVTSSRAHDRYPAVVVTSSQASVAGTASGNCVSRFSPLHGQDGDHVLALELITATGQRLRCTRDGENADVFFGVTGGLGYLGAITKVTLALQANPHDQVETRVLAAGSVREVLAAIGPGALAGPATRYAVLLPALDRGMAYESEYVSGLELAPYRPVHQPRSVLRLLGELVMRSSWGARLVWAIGFRTLARRYVDPLFDFTFMMDGNARLRRIGRRLGFAMRVIQQSFVVPVDATGDFLARARQTFAASSLFPTMSDVLYSPSDHALLSATHGLNGFFVSFAFETSRRSRLERISRAFTALSKECHALGGRVHLTKNVRADAEDLAAMYAATLPAFAALKHRLDPERRIRNAFLERTFPSLA